MTLSTSSSPPGPPVIDAVTIASLGATLALLLLAYLAARALLPARASNKDRATFVWLAFDALTHFVLEGSWLWLSTFGRTVQSASGPFATLWQEYTFADARWGRADETVVSIEALTVLAAGPLCVWILYQIVRQDAARHYWIVVLCTAEIYGGAMTFFPEWFTGSSNLNTSHWMYTWVYLAFFNGLWIVIPLALMLDSYWAISGSLRAVQEAEQKHKRK